MAKKFVRGVTGVDDIEKFDKTLTNVNDLLSDGQNTYVHTKKGKNEFYYNITSAINKIQSSDNTLTITKDNDTVSISNKSLATKQELAGKQDILSVGDGLQLSNNEIDIAPTYLLEAPAKNGIYKSYVTNDGQLSAIISLNTSENKYVQFAFRESTVTSGKMLVKYRFINDNVKTQWFNILMSESEITSLINTKQDTLNSSLSIGVTNGTWLRQLYTKPQTYNTSNGVLKTHVKSIANSASVGTSEEEFNFIVKINKGATSASFTLNNDDKIKFTNIMNAYGQNNSVRISGLIFTLSGSSLTVTTANSVDHNYVVTFSDII